jgi:putative membrane protein
MYGAYGHGWMFGGLGMILVWAVPLALVFLFARSLFARGGDAGKTPPPARSPLDILNESYVCGEIEREEYLRKRDDLLGR